MILNALAGQPKDVPLESLPADRLADALRELVANYRVMADCAGTLRDFLDAAHDRFAEERPDLARRTIEAAHELLAAAESELCR